MTKTRKSKRPPFQKREKQKQNKIALTINFILESNKFPSGKNKGIFAGVTLSVSANCYDIESDEKSITTKNYAVTIKGHSKRHENVRIFGHGNIFLSILFFSILFIRTRWRIFGKSEKGCEKKNFCHDGNKNL